MGVTGLWSLLEPAGKPIPLESLENKILAVDVSIWLNQAVKGFRDRSGNAVPNAHILGLFHRICKLLFYKIRPIFVFDGQAPELKKETLRRRRMKLSKAGKQARIASAKILDNYIRTQAVASQLKRQTLAIDKVLQKGQEGLLDAIHQRNKQEEKDLFQLPPMVTSELDNHFSDSEEDEERERLRSKFDLSDIHHLDVHSKDFKRLPKDLQYEILSELKERRKQNSWHKMSEMPKVAENFSGFQVERLLKRSQIQKSLENVGKNLGQDHVGALDSQLFVGDVEGIKRAKAESKKIASDATGRHYLYISGIKAAQQQSLDNTSSSSDEDSPDSDYDPGEALAEKITASDEISQSDILFLLKNSKDSNKRHKSVVHSDEDLLEPSNSSRFSNRRGGMTEKELFVQQSNKEFLSESWNFDHKYESPIPSTSSLGQSLFAPKIDEANRVGEISDTESSSSGSFESIKSIEEKIENVEEDIFDGVFESKDSHNKLYDILKEAHLTTEVQNQFSFPAQDNKFTENVLLPRSGKIQIDPYEDIKRSLEDRKLETTEDIFARITKNARRAIVPPSKPETQNLVRNVENVSAEKGIDREEIANNMKKSDHLWLKIASKWVLEDKNSTPSSSISANKEPHKESYKFQKQETADLEAEGANLIKEMKNSENNKQMNPSKVPNVSHILETENTTLINEMRRSEQEQRLLRIKSLDQKPKPLVKPQSASKLNSNEDESLLEKLGVQLIKSSDYEKKVEKEEGLELVREDESKVSYGSSAPGFVRASTRGSNVVEMEEPAERHLEESDSAVKNHPLFEVQSVVEKLSNEESLLSNEELIALQNSLAKEQQTLIAERSHQDRLAATITDQMYADCQELLQLFGLPWIVSPSEAEAQCAFLDANGLSHGTITDDSDVWVFGGQKVYKNFFNQSKHCEQFMASDIAKHFGLSREKMILLAELTGSDYTEGVESVGPVTALEILAEFPGPGLLPLKSFKAWWEKFQADVSLPPGSKLKEKLVRLRLPESFPSEAVYVAYLNPVVDNSTERFSWAVPNLVAVRDFAADKFGWQWQKIDEMLKPVIKKLSTKITQERIDNFFMSERMVLPEKGNYQTSKRVKEAIDKVLGKSPEKPGPKKRKRPATAAALPEPVDCPDQKKILGSSASEMPDVPGLDSGPPSRLLEDPPVAISIEEVKKRTLEKLKTGDCAVRGKRKIDIEMELLGRPVKEPDLRKETVPLPPTDWRKREADQKLEAKQRAIAIFKQARESKNPNPQTGRSRKRKKFVGPVRRVLPNHVLSDTESD